MALAATFRHFLLLLLGVLFGSLYAQNHTYIFNQLSSLDGLTAANGNYYVHHDQEGFIWISSPAGLNRYDGLRIKQYLADASDPHALSTANASQSAFYDTPDGKLWFTENGALIAYDRQQDHFDRYHVTGPNGDTIKSGYSWCFVDTILQRVWFNTANNFVYTASMDALHAPHLLDSLYINIEAKMYTDDEGYPQLVSFVEGALIIRRYTLNGDNFGNKKVSAPVAAKIYEVLPINDTLIWVGSSKGLWQFNLKRNYWRRLPLEWQGKPILNISEISVRSPDCFLLGSDHSGVYFFNPLKEEINGQIFRFRDEETTPLIPLPDHRLYLDKADNLWLSTVEDGLLFTNLSKPKFSKLHSGSAYQAAIYALGESMLGDIWAIAKDGVYQINNQSTKYYPLPKTGANFNQPVFFYRDRDNNNWVGTLSALFLRKPEQEKFQPFKQIATSPTGGTSGYTSMIQLANGDYLIGTVFGPPIRLRADWSSYTILNLDDDFTPVIELVNQQIFIYGYGNENYLRIYQQIADQLILDTMISGLETINDIVYDQQKRYWIATSDGLCILQKKGPEWQLSKDSILTKGSISSLLIDSEHQLWLGTPRGISRYRPDSAEVYAYHLSDGLQGSHFNRAAALVTQAGDFVFGGNNGINLFRPEEIQSKIPQAQPMIVDILINQQVGIAHLYSSDTLRNPAYIKQLTLPFDKNNLELHLAPREYSEPQKCTFSYRLLGSTDEQEVNLGENKVLRFNNLSEGHYSLQIWATNADGIKSETYQELKIEVAPPWYRTTWFFALILALIFSGLYTFYRYRLHLLTQRKNAEIEAANAQAQAARSAAQKAQSEMAVMRLQMNPHFVFNSLNSIDAHILKENPLEAHDFLIRFADLMRRILDQSEEQLSTVDDEIIFLQEYLAIEQARFGERMQYTIHVDPTLNRFSAKIPTMVLQPFIENAIVHGISGKKNDGHITINFQQTSDGQLHIEVKDNGVGRQVTKNHSGHQSKATTITERRLAVLAESLQLATVPRFEIIDEQDTNGQANGTTVRFYFPDFNI